MLRPMPTRTRALTRALATAAIVTLTAAGVLIGSSAASASAVSASVVSASVASASAVPAVSTADTVGSLTPEQVAANSGTVVAHVSSDPRWAEAMLQVWTRLPHGEGYHYDYEWFVPGPDGTYSSTVASLAGPVWLVVVFAQQTPDADRIAASGGEDSSTPAPPSDSDELQQLAAPQELAAPQDDADPWRSNAVVVRHSTIDYRPGTARNEWIPDDVPVAPAPTSDELPLLIPAADYTTTHAPYSDGDPVDVAFRDVVSVYDGQPLGEGTPASVTAYGYSAPTPIGPSTITDGSADLTVPAEFSDGPHTIAAFDEYGRLTLRADLEGGAPVPSPVPAALIPADAGRPALAHTGVDEPSTAGAAVLALTALLLGASALAASAIRRRRPLSR